MKRSKIRSRVAVVVFSHYPEDPRVKRETEALIALGFDVDIFCLRGEGESSREKQGAARIYRFPINKKRGSKGRYILEYGLFTSISLWKLSSLHFVKPYRLVHIHNMPDFLVFSAFLPRLSGAKIILDLHDPTPEVFMTKYKIGSRHPLVRLLKLIERGSIRFAHIVLTPNKAFKEVFTRRGAPREKIHIVMNSPQEELFNIEEVQESKKDSSFRIMFHGTLVERHGLDTALYAVKMLKGRIPSLTFDVYGAGDFVEAFKNLVNELELADVVKYHGKVPLQKIPSAIAQCSVGVIPNKKSPFTEINLPTRIFEYLCLGKPVVAPRTCGILDYFDDKSLFFFEPGDHKSLSEALWRVYAYPEDRKHIVERGMKVYKQYRWKKECLRFQQIVRKLLWAKSSDRVSGSAETIQQDQRLQKAFSLS